MLLFSTVLNISRRMTPDRFLKLVLKWNAGSTHASNVIRDIVWNGERNIRFGKDDLWMEFKEYKKENIIAVRYEKIEDESVVWDSDYVMNFNTMQMSIRLDRSYMQDIQNVNPRYSTPHFISMLIEEDYVESDHNLKVKRTPHVFKKEDLPHIAKIIREKADYDMPIVIVTKTRNNQYPFDVDRLASKLKGAAHVLIQEDYETTWDLKNLCNGDNPYMGACDIIFPNPAFKRRRFIFRRGTRTDDFLMDRITRTLIQYVNAQRIDSLLTWQGVSNAILRERFQIQRQARLKAEEKQKKAEEDKVTMELLMTIEEKRSKEEINRRAEEEANKLLDAFDADMQKLQKENESMAQKIERLEYENEVLRERLDNLNQKPLLFMGNEPDMFEGEIRDYVLEILDDAYRKTGEKTRKKDVLKDILSTNEYEALHVQKRAALKTLLKNYTKLNASIRSDLAMIGLDVSKDNHPKLRFPDDSRYLYVLSGTSGDGRTGQNSISGITNLFL